MDFVDIFYHLSQFTYDHNNCHFNMVVLSCLRVLKQQTLVPKCTWEITAEGHHVLTTLQDWEGYYRGYRCKPWKTTCMAVSSMRYLWDFSPFFQGIREHFHTFENNFSIFFTSFDWKTSKQTQVVLLCSQHFRHLWFRCCGDSSFSKVRFRQAWNPSFTSK